LALAALASIATFPDTAGVITANLENTPPVPLIEIGGTGLIAESLQRVRAGEDRQAQAARRRLPFCEGVGAELVAGPSS